MKPIAEGLCLRWEKPTKYGVRYYTVDLHQDLWGEWLLTQAWGRRGTRLGRVRSLPCSSQAEGLARVATIQKQRRRHHYVVVADANPHDEVR
ncbi:MAG TPA: WGR domain-containing protein [Candidatus Competibacter phosphatis]|nr:WGR domain-containing protein [Candidatus Competibacter phosphatis]